jgi:fused signal recognition particle receptor
MLKFFKKLGQSLRSLFSKPVDEESLEALEELLFEADLGPKLTLSFSDQIRSLLKKKGTLSSSELLSHLRSLLLSCLPSPSAPSLASSPHIILFVGVNGSGKTTSLAKLAAYYQSQGRSVLVAAGDTFRAAASEQLALLAKRLNIDCIHSQHGADPSSVAFDAVRAAKARQTDLLLIDTAGRLQNKQELMQELSKICRVIGKECPGAPHEILLVLDATTGQNGLDQARLFQAAAPLTGLILTKLDGSAKGGIAFAIHSELSLPILWVGSGEQLTDFAQFSPVAYVDALLL